MGHTSITIGLLFGLASLGSQVQPASVPRVATQSSLPAAPSTQVEDVTAAAVVESLRARFAGTDVEFKFDSFASDQSSQQDLEVHGAGRFRLAGGQAWMPVRYSALYDTVTSSIDSPELTFAGQEVAIGQAMLDTGALGALVSRQLSDEFASQPVDFDLGPVTLVAGDARYAMAQADGVASFGSEGAASVSVQGVFDRGTGRWLGVRYTLDADDAA
jgi:hypothetical protein